MTAQTTPAAVATLTPAFEFTTRRPFPGCGERPLGAEQRIAQDRAALPRKIA